jgi:hypothetical protein
MLLPHLPHMLLLHSHDVAGLRTHARRAQCDGSSHLLQARPIPPSLTILPRPTSGMLLSLSLAILYSPFVRFDMLIRALVNLPGSLSAWPSSRTASVAGKTGMPPLVVALATAGESAVMAAVGALSPLPSTRWRTSPSMLAPGAGTSMSHHVACSRQPGSPHWPQR